MNVVDRILIKVGSEKKRAKIWAKNGLNVNPVGGVSIGSNVGFGSEPYLIKIGNNVRITKNVQFITHDGGLWVIRNLYPEFANADLIKPITVGDNVHIGIGAIIMPGVHIGNNCVIGCGAVVTKDIPDFSIAVGVPARVIETLDEYVKKNKQYYTDTHNLSSSEKRNLLLK